MPFDPTTVIQDPRWDAYAQDPDKLAKAEEKLWTTFVSSYPDYSAKLAAMPEDKQTAERERFSGMLRVKFPTKFPPTREARIVAGAEENLGIDQAAAAETNKDVEATAQEVSAKPIGTPGVDTIRLGDAMTGASAPDALVEAAKRTPDYVPQEGPEFHKPGYVRPVNLADQNQKYWQDQVEAWAKDRSAAQRVWDYVATSTRPGRVAQGAASLIHGEGDPLKPTKGALAQAAVSLGKEEPKSNVEGFARWTLGAASEIAPFALAPGSAAVKPLLVNLGMEFAAQSGDAVQGGHYSKKELIKAGLLGGVFMLPLPAALKTQSGGAATRVGKHVGAAALRTAEFQIPEIAMGDQPTRKDFINTFGLFLAMDAVNMTRAGMAGSIEGRLRKTMPDVDPKWATYFANEAIYANNPKTPGQWSAAIRGKYGPKAADLWERRYNDTLRTDVSKEELAGQAKARQKLTDEAHAMMVDDLVKQARTMLENDGGIEKFGRAFNAKYGKKPAAEPAPAAGPTQIDGPPMKPVDGEAGPKPGTAPVQPLEKPAAEVPTDGKGAVAETSLEGGMGIVVGGKYNAGMKANVVVFDNDTGATAPRGDGTDVEYIKYIWKSSESGDPQIIVNTRRATDAELEKARKRREEEAADDMDAVPAAQRWRSVTPQEDVRVAGRWQVVPAASLITSDKPEYDQELQPRNRNTAASQEQIAKIALGPDPLRLDDSAVTDSGSPIVDERGQVISGNGRTIGLRKAYASGRAGPYDAFVQDRARQLGLSVEGIENPVLVRQILDAGGQPLAKIAELSNRPQILQRTDAELAEADAKILLGSEIMDVFNPDAIGTIRAGSNREFNRAFVQATGDQGLRTSDGSFAPALEGRVRRAVLAAVLGRSPNGRELVRQALEQADTLGIKRQLDGIMVAGGQLLKIGKQKPQFDITGHLADALQAYMAYKRDLANGLVKNLGDFVAQGDMFATPRGQEVEYLLEELDQRTSIKSIKAFIDEYARLVSRVDTTTTALFGDVPDATAAELIGRARNVGKETEEVAQGNLAGLGEKPAKPTAEVAGGSQPADAQGPVEPPSKTWQEWRSALVRYSGATAAKTFDEIRVKSGVDAAITFALHKLVDQSPRKSVGETPDERSSRETEGTGADNLPDNGRRSNAYHPVDGPRWQGWLEDGRSILRRANPQRRSLLDQVEVDHELGATLEFKEAQAFAGMAGLRAVPITKTTALDGTILSKVIYLARSRSLSIMQVMRHEVFHFLAVDPLGRSLVDMVDRKSPAFIAYRKELVSITVKSRVDSGEEQTAAAARVEQNLNEDLIAEELACDLFGGIENKYGVRIADAFPDVAKANTIVGDIDRGMRDQSKGDPELFASMQERGPPGTIDARNSLAAGWPGGDLGTPGVPVPIADDPDQHMPIELPELVKLYNDLTGGRYPKIVRKLHGALGVFSSVPGRRGPEHIKLLASAFKLITPEESAVMMADAKAYVAANPGLVTPTMSAEQLTQERYEHLYETAYKDALTKNPKLASKVMAHELMHFVDFLPDLAHLHTRGNILGHVAAFRGYLLKSLAALPSSPELAIDPAVRKQLRKDAAKLVGKRPPKTDPAAVAAWNDAVSKEYGRLIQDYADANGFVTVAGIKAELEPLIAWWRHGGTKMEPYFREPWEMFAEAGSIMLNNPAAVAKRAPKFFRLFHDWLPQSRPEILREYNAIQDAIKSGTVQRDRVQHLRSELGRSTEIAGGLEQQSNRLTWRERADRFRYTFSRVFGPTLWRVKKIKDPDARGAVEQAIGDYLYRKTHHELYLARVRNEVMVPLLKAGLDFMDLAEFMFHNHVVNNRADIANPYGWTAKTSAERLAEMQRNLPTEKWNALVAVQAEFWNVRQSEVINKVKQSEIFDTTGEDVIQNRQFYHTVAPVRANAMPDTAGSDIESLLAGSFGVHVGAKLAKQYGFLGSIKNPFLATMQKDLALLNMAYRESAKRAIIDALINSPFANEWKPAEMVWTGQRREVKEINTNRVGTLIFVHLGKVHAFYGPRALVDAFEYGDPIENRLFAALNRVLSQTFTRLYTQLNYGFWPVAYARDIGSFRDQMPGARRVGARSFWAFRGKARAAARSSIMGEPNAAARDALGRGIVVSRVEPMGEPLEPDPIDELLVRHNIPPASWRVPPTVRGAPGVAAPVVNAIRRAWELWRTWGQVNERTVKIAGLMYLDKFHPSMPEAKKRELAREMSGSPDFLSRGAGASYVNLLLPLYNPIVRGVESTAKSWKDRPGERAWKSIKYTLMPLLGFELLRRGLMAWLIGDDDSKEIQEMIDAVPTYDRDNYKVWPLGFVDRANKKVAYLRIPMHEGERIVHVIFSKLLRADKRPVDARGAFNVAGGQVPGINPLLKVGSAWYTYAVTGVAPIDSFNGSQLMSTDQALAGEGQMKLAKFTWNQLGGTIITRFGNFLESDTEPTKLEKFLRLPVISNTLGRWIKVSNRGVSDRLETPRHQVEVSQAKIRLRARDMIERGMAGQPFTASDKLFYQTDPYFKNYVDEKWTELQKLKLATPELRALLRAGSSQEQAAVLQEIMRGP